MVLRSPCISLQVLKNLENTLEILRGEMGPEAMGARESEEHPKELFSYSSSINQSNFFKILMSSTQVTYHFQCTIPPHNKSGSFSTKIKLGEEPWRCGNLKGI